MDKTLVKCKFCGEDNSSDDYYCKNCKGRLKAFDNNIENVTRPYINKIDKDTSKLLGNIVLGLAGIFYSLTVLSGGGESFIFCSFSAFFWLFAGIGIYIVGALNQINR